MEERKWREGGWSRSGLSYPFSLSPTCPPYPPPLPPPSKRRGRARNVSLKLLYCCIASQDHPPGKSNIQNRTGNKHGRNEKNRKTWEILKNICNHMEGILDNWETGKHAQWEGQHQNKRNVGETPSEEEA